MSTATQTAPIATNPHPDTASTSPSPTGNPAGGPRTDAGCAISSQNAMPDSQTGPQALSPHNDCRQTDTSGRGLYSTRDFVRPGEEPAYRELSEALRTELAPGGILEDNLVDEIRRAMWRLGRCGEIEETFVAANLSGADPGTGPIPDPMQHEAHAKLQLSVDRARSQAHRLLHKCTAELRKLQTERRLRHESFEAGTDLSHFGLCDWAFISKSLDAQFIAGFQRRKLQGMAEIEAILSTPPRPPAKPGSFCKTGEAPAQTPRNAQAMRHAA